MTFRQNLLSRTPMAMILLAISDAHRAWREYRMWDGDVEPASKATH